MGLSIDLAAAKRLAVLVISYLKANGLVREQHV